jgi:hypothetical protein
MDQDQKNFMDRYMAAFSRLTDAQARGEDVNKVFAEMKGSVSGPPTEQTDFMNNMNDPGPSADFTTAPRRIPEGIDPSLFNEIPVEPERDMGALPQTQQPQAVSPMGSMINNVDDFLSNLGRKVGQ